MALILAATLAAQSSPSAIEAARGDLEFARGVEEFVIAAAPGGSPPEPYRGLIDRLGGSSWRGRDADSRRHRSRTSAGCSGAACTSTPRSGSARTRSSAA